MVFIREEDFGPLGGWVESSCYHQGSDSIKGTYSKSMTEAPSGPHRDSCSVLAKVEGMKSNSQAPRAGSAHLYTDSFTGKMSCRVPSDLPDVINAVVSGHSQFSYEIEFMVAT